ncbi:MAG: hypothetical protein AB9873_04840 [Syntrophobacteraceae bacterium]
MKKPVVGVALAIGLLLTLASPGHTYETPRSIASITLGTMVTDVQDKVDLGSAVPLGGANFLMRAPLKPVRGFESGYVVYGNCKEKGRIVRIKVKYENDDEAFYNEVLSALKHRYGKPAEWRGNPFGTLKIWKWSLKDAARHSIGIQLQHYEGDDDAFTPGNSFKITHGSYLEEEKACYEQTRKDEKQASRSGTATGKMKFEDYLPR